MFNAVANAVEARMAPSHTDGTVPEANPEHQPAPEAPDGPREKMLALTWQGVNKVEMQQCDVPVLINDHDVIINITGTTVCGSDLHLMHGALLEMNKHDILGHEFCGVIAEVGSKVSKRKVGERVVVSFQIACGSCFYCRQRLSSQCVNTNASSLEPKLYGHKTAGMFGYSHLTGSFAGGQCEVVRVPWGDVNCLPIPDSVPDEAALYLSDMLPTSYHTVVDTGVKDGDCVAVWGAGPIGLLCAHWAFLKGAKRVFLIDRDWRLEYAKSKIPEVETIDFSQVKDVPAKLRELTRDEEVPGVDVALECAAGEYAKSLLHKAQLAVGLELDTPEIVNECILSVKNFGRVGVTGIYTGFCNGFAIGAVMEKGVRFIGCGQAPVHKYWDELLQMLVDKKIDPISLFVTHRLPLEETALLYKKQDAHENSIMKAFITTKYSSEPSPGAPKLSSLRD